MHLFTSILLIAGLVSYREPQQKVGVEAKPKLNKDSNVLQGRCAVIVRPDDRKIELMRKHSSENDYAAVVNDNEYYMGLSVAFLDSVKIKQIAKPARGVLIFKSSTGQYFKIALAPFDWGVILFNGRSKPIEADVTDIDADYRAYMKK